MAKSSKLNGSIKRNGINVDKFTDSSDQSQRSVCDLKKDVQKKSSTNVQLCVWVARYVHASCKRVCVSEERWWENNLELATAGGRGVKSWEFGWLAARGVRSSCSHSHVTHWLNGPSLLLFNQKKCQDDFNVAVLSLR